MTSHVSGFVIREKEIPVTWVFQLFLEELPYALRGQGKFESLLYIIITKGSVGKYYKFIYV